MPLSGVRESFASCTVESEARALFEEVFPEVLDLQQDLPSQFTNNPVRTIPVVHQKRYVWGSTVALAGDSGHAMAPFMGQGLNCGMEDARLLNECLEEAGAWTAATLSRYEHLRLANARAASEMSTEHYQRLVGVSNPVDPIEKRLQELYPLLFVPIYERCAFHEQTYSQAQKWDAITKFIVKEMSCESAPVVDISADAFKLKLFHAIMRLPEDLQREFRESWNHVEMFKGM
jgi:kynurenine 3-monooxygenase